MRAKLCLAAVAVLLLFGVAWDPAQAHGGGTAQLVDQPVGPYRVYLWSKPEPMRVGNAHFTIGVFEAPGGNAADVPILDAQVEVALEPQGSQAEGFSGRASREASSNKLYYELDFDLPAEGDWQANVTVSGPAGAGQARFEFRALPPSPLNWTVIGAAAVLLVAIWWWSRSRSYNSDSA